MNRNAEEAREEDNGKYTNNDEEGYSDLDSINCERKESKCNTSTRSIVNDSDFVLRMDPKLDDDHNDDNVGNEMEEKNTTSSG